jgi:hypothetical protein
MTKPPNLGTIITIIKRILNPPKAIVRKLADDLPVKPPIYGPQFLPYAPREARELPGWTPEFWIEQVKRDEQQALRWARNRGIL